MVLFTEKELQIKIKEIADSLNKKQDPMNPSVFICVLNGGFMFFTDLIKQIKNPCYVDFIQVKSYIEKEKQEIELLKGLSLCSSLLKNKDIFLIDDIYDSGSTINYLINYLQNFDPKSITPVTLFKKWFSWNDKLIYGIKLQNEYWIYGYGLDDVEKLNRNLPYILGETIEN